MACDTVCVHECEEGGSEKVVERIRRSLNTVVVDVVFYTAYAYIVRRVFPLQVQY